MPSLAVMKLIAIALLLAAVASAAMWYRSSLIEDGRVEGRAEVQEKWDKETKARKAAEDAALVKRVADNIKEKADQEKLKAKEKENHETAIAVLTQNLAAAKRDIAARGGLRIPRPAGGCEGPAASTEAGSTAGSDSATAGTVALPDEITRNLLDLVDEADKVTEQARTCKAFVEDNGMSP